MFKPLMMNLTPKEQMDVYRALDIGLAAVKREGGINANLIAKIEDARKMLNEHERVGGWDSQAEADASSIANFAEDCRLNGCD